ncbi:MAG TPA: YhjD/YihY/BrkB family envelope integrity protein [Actinomycetota bacterium]
MAPRFVSFARDVLERSGRDRSGYLAATVTYYGFLSLFPLLLLGLSVIGFVLADRPNLQEEIVDAVAGAVPGLQDVMGESLDSLVDARAASGLIGLAGLVWSGLGATEAAGFAVSRIFRVHPYASFVKRKLWSLWTTIVLGLMAVTALGIVALVGNLPVSGWAAVSLRAGGLVVAFVLDVALFLVGYRLLTQRQGPPFGALWRGAIFAAVAWGVVKVVGTWYVAGTVSRSSAVYGTLASAVGILLLIYAASQLLLYGAEVNAVALERAGKDLGSVERGIYVEGDGEMRRTVNGERSTGDLVRSIATDTSQLVRKQIELAKQEMAEGAKAKAVGGAALGAAAIFGLIAFVFLGVTMAAALRIVWPAWLAWIVTAATFLLLAGVIAGVGVSRMKRPVVPEETKRTVKEDVEWAKAQLRR